MAREESKWKRAICGRKKKRGRREKRCEENLGVQKWGQERKKDRRWATESTLTWLLPLADTTHLPKHPGLCNHLWSKHCYKRQNGLDRNQLSAASRILFIPCTERKRSIAWLPKFQRNSFIKAHSGSWSLFNGTSGRSLKTGVLFQDSLHSHF